jgi:hypothetical protein
MRRTPFQAEIHGASAPQADLDREDPAAVGAAAAGTAPRVGA